MPSKMACKMVGVKGEMERKNKVKRRFWGIR